MAALISFSTVVVAYTVIATYIRYGLELPERDPESQAWEPGVHSFVNKEGETVDYFAPSDYDGEFDYGEYINCYSEIPYFKDGPTGHLATIGWTITAIIEMTTAVSLGASYFLTPGRDDGDEDKTMETDAAGDPDDS
jgi:hypothetical protein